MDITMMSEEEFRNSIISRNAYDDYDAYGYIVAYNGKQAAIARFSHCSCYGTYESLTGGKNPGICWDWKGTLKGLLKLARNKLDPHYVLGKSRKAVPEDSDYCYLMACYDDVLKWYEERQK